MARETYGERIRQFRRIGNQTLVPPAKLLGMSIVHLSEIEQGIRPPLPPADTVRLLQLYGVSEDMLEPAMHTLNALAEHFNHAVAAAEAERAGAMREAAAVARDAIVKAADGQVGIRGHIDCPICTKALGYAVYFNGHVWARCSNETCVGWVE